MKALEEDFQIVGREFLKRQYSTNNTFPSSICGENHNVRHVIKHGSLDACRAYDNCLTRIDYGQKLLVNTEDASSLYTVRNEY